METRKKQTAENYIKDIRRKTRRLFSSEQKIQIIMEALRAESSIEEIMVEHKLARQTVYNTIYRCIVTLKSGK